MLEGTKVKAESREVRVVANGDRAITTLLVLDQDGSVIASFDNNHLSLANAIESGVDTIDITVRLNLVRVDADV